jgi:hypothetical protein
MFQGNAKRILHPRWQGKGRDPVTAVPVTAVSDTKAIRFRSTRGDWFDACSDSESDAMTISQKRVVYPAADSVFRVAVFKRLSQKNSAKGCMESGFLPSQRMGAFP